MAHMESQFYRLRAQHQRFLAAWRDNEIANLRRQRSQVAQPEAALRSSVRRLALEGPDSGAWLAISRAQFEAGQWSAGLDAAAEAVRVGLLEPAALAAVADRGPAWAVAKVFRADTLAPSELGELYHSLRSWPSGQVLRHVLLRALFQRVRDDEEQTRLAEQPALPSDNEDALGAVVREAWRELSEQPAKLDSETVPAHEAWLHAAPYDWAPALQALLPPSTTGADGVRFAQRSAAFDAEVAWARRRCGHYLLRGDITDPQAVPRALQDLRGLHSEPWRMVGFETLAAAWPSPSTADTGRWGHELVGAARRFGDPVRRARCLYAAGALVMPYDPRQGAVCWQQARDILSRNQPERAARILPAAMGAALRAASDGAETPADDELTVLLTRLQLDGDGPQCAHALLGALPAPDGERRQRVLDTIASLPAAEQPQVAFLLAMARRDLGTMADCLVWGWPTAADGAPWLAMALATGRMATFGDVEAVRRLAEWFLKANDSAGQPAVAAATMLAVRAERLEGRPDAPRAQPLLKPLANLQDEQLDAAILALGACSDGAGAGWLRAVETAFLQRLEHARPGAPMSLPHFEMLLEILAQAQIEARVREWLDEYRAAVERWMGASLAGGSGA